MALDPSDLAVAQLVHDLQNQLTLLLGCADNLSWLTPAGEGQKDVSEVHHCAERALAIAREILAAGRIQGVTRASLDLNRAVVPAVQTLAHLMGDRVRLRLRLAADPILVVADVLEIERILLNLAMNARDAMAGEGVLTIATEIVADPDPRAKLTVTDTGSGMTPDVRSRIFEPYFTTKPKGTGLGLPSVGFTVRQLRGTIAVESEPRQGTTVTVRLPVAP